MRGALALVALLVSACGGGEGAARPVAPAPAVVPPTEAPKAEGFAVPADVGSLVADERAFAEAARGWRPELAVLAEAREVRMQQLFVTAMLDALDGRWDQALAGIDRVAELEQDPALKAMTGLTIRVWADARANGGDTPEAFRAALERRLAALPTDTVREHLSMLRTMSQVFTPEVCRQMVAAEVGPRAKGGSITLADLHIVVFQRYAVARLVPVASIIDQVLGARGIEPVQRR